MGKEMPGSFYTGKGYMKEGIFELYLPLYKWVASLLPSPQKMFSNIRFRVWCWIFCKSFV